MPYIQGIIDLVGKFGGTMDIFFATSTGIFAGTAVNIAMVTASYPARIYSKRKEPVGLTLFPAAAIVL